MLDFQTIFDGIDFLNANPPDFLLNALTSIPYYITIPILILVPILIKTGLFKKYWHPELLRKEINHLNERINNIEDCKLKTKFQVQINIATKLLNSSVVQYIDNVISKKEKTITSDEWIERCYQQYLQCGITNESKAKSWAESTFHRLGCNTLLNPEKAAKDDLESWN